MRAITAYHCDYCRRVLVTAKAMEQHEKKCIRNPAMKTCATCQMDKTGDLCPHLPYGERIEFECIHWAPVEEPEDEGSA